MNMSTKTMLQGIAVIGVIFLLFAGAMWLSKKDKANALEIASVEPAAIGIDTTSTHTI